MEITTILAFDEREFPAASRLGAALAAPVVMVDRHRFPDGEMRLRLPVVLSGRVLLWRSLDRPNDKLVELLIAAPAARELGARELVLACPYLAYMRQDAAFAPGEAVSQRHVGRFLSGLFDTVLTVDPHLHRVSSLDAVLPGCRTIVVSAAGALGAHVAALADDPLLIGPDEESLPWVRRAALEGARTASRRRPLDHTTCIKQRLGNHAVTIRLADDVALAGRRVVLVDDLASTARTLEAAARICLARGAASVDAAVVHALLDEDAERSLRQAGVRRLWSSCSVPHRSNAIDVVPLLAAALAA